MKWKSEAAFVRFFVVILVILVAIGLYTKGNDLHAGFAVWGSTQKATLEDDIGDGFKKHTPMGSTLKSIDTFDPRYS